MFLRFTNRIKGLPKKLDSDLEMGGGKDSHSVKISGLREALWVAGEITGPDPNQSNGCDDEEDGDYDEVDGTMRSSLLENESYVRALHEGEQQLNADDNQNYEDGYEQEDDANEPDSEADRVLDQTAQLRQLNQKEKVIQEEIETLENEWRTARDPPLIDGEDVLDGYNFDENETIQRLESRISKLKEDAAQIKAGRKAIEGNKLVRWSRRSFRKSRNTFISELFDNIQNGDLRHLQAKVAALDLSQPENDSLPHLKNWHNHPPLFVAILFNHENIVEFLLDHSGHKLTSQPICLKDESKNEVYELTPLQLALFYGNTCTIKKIVDCIPNDKEKQAYINEKIFVKSHMGQPFGELPLAATTWSCMKFQSSDKVINLDDINDILQHLVRNGADLDMRTEKEGNTLLHLIVLQALECTDGLEYFKGFLIDVFGPAAHIWGEKQNDNKIKAKPVRHLMNMKNKAGLTPLVLAAKVESPLYHELHQLKDVMRLHDTKAPRFTPTYYYYIKDIASIDQNGEYNDKSVMHVLAHSMLDLCHKTWKTDIVDTEPVKSLIEMKWKFYRWFFYGWGLFHFLFMTMFTVFCLQDTSLNANASNINVSNILRENISLKKATVEKGTANPYFSFFLTAPILYIIFEIIDLVSMWKGHECYYSVLGNLVYRTIVWIFSVFTITWFSLHWAGDINQDILLALSLFFGWIFCIFFTRTMCLPSRQSQIGAFSVMAQRMLFHDVLPFILISFFIIISFSTAIQATLSFFKPPENADMSFGHTFYQMLKYFAAMDDPMNEELSRVKEFAKALLVIYGIIIAVLLITMLIAAINKSYDIIRETQCNLVARQRLAILLLLERRLPCLRSIPQKSLLNVIEYDHEGDPWIKITNTTTVGEMMNSRSPHKKEKQS